MISKSAKSNIFRHFFAEPLVTFYPCEHRVVCSDCATRVKKCLTCHVPLEKQLPGAGTGVAHTREEKERLKSLELKVQVSEWGCLIVRFADWAT
jgi:hypothetical protein